ncbi:YchJ family protein [Zoogloea sp.]|uniref:YchJ family protein n=1 Tax=Zoogloea sp. TaxID=49181 RepID=UPI0035B4357A
MPFPCPCGASADHARCCGPYLSGERPAPDAEALMRSRYTAYTLGHEHYLRATWHPAHRPDSLNLAEDGATKWLGLEIKACRSIDASHATVEFVARYKIGGRAYRLHETSRFVLEDGRWLYTDGDIHPK